MPNNSTQATVSPPALFTTEPVNVLVTNFRIMLKQYAKPQHLALISKNSTRLRFYSKNSYHNSYKN